MALRIKTSAGTIRDINTSERDEIRESLGITGSGASAPSAPTIGTLTAGNGTVSGAFTPGVNGGSAIIEYEMLLSNDNSATGTSSPISRASPNGTAVTARVRARNAVDWGPYSAASNSATPTAVSAAPDAPTITGVTAADGGVSIAFAPAATGAPATEFRAFLSTSQYATGSSSPLFVAAPNGTAVTAKIRAKNAVDYSLSSGPSTPVTPLASGPTPGNITLTAGSSDGTSQNLSWTASSNATRYQVSYKKAADASYAVVGYTTGQTYKVPGLTMLTAYNFRVIPMNGAGSGTHAVVSATTEDIAKVMEDEFADATVVAVTSRASALGGTFTGSAKFVTTGAGTATLASDYATDDMILTPAQPNGNYSVAANVQCTWTDAANKAVPRLIFRYVDANNFWFVHFDLQAKFAYVTKRVAGVETQMMTSHTYSQTTGRKMEVRVDCWKNNITLCLDADPKATVTDSDLAATGTKCGLSIVKTGTPPAIPVYGSFWIRGFCGVKLVWPEFTKYSQDPILPKGPAGSWDATDINNPNVVYGPVGPEMVNMWVMDYSGNGAPMGGSPAVPQHHGFATAPTKFGPWTKMPGNPLQVSAAGKNWEWNGGLSYWRGLWWITSSAFGGNITLYTSPNLEPGSFREHGIILSSSQVSAWGSGQVSDPVHRITQDDRLEMLFSSVNSGSIGRCFLNEDFTCSQITSTAPFFKPTVSVTGNLRIGEACNYSPPGYEGIRFLASFDGNRTYDTGSNRVICQVISLNSGATWHTRYYAVGPRGGGAWESAQAFDSFVYVEDDVMYMWHAGSDLPGSTLLLNTQYGLDTAPWVFKDLIEA